MGDCKLDHSQEDVRKKLADQRAYLPDELENRLDQLLDQPLSQERLNELFHLLKKYDLAAPEERAARDAKLRELLG
ncbi:50S ribosomal protein L7ae [Brevibacillus sp. SYP-B805]|uniref:50S ribosomal protein L7ae n=1 Tax=Brevibacillus sp. SYP-B805 TaxID=1578199 RepID=UPI0013E9C9CB|nr:50S ribosomal protein L7ae [Brevibacillus sp. SYP-B805]NGQ96243.1 50S ribosomal protein L7ae [Brevibacillus sp. SYP-B805]